MKTSRPDLSLEEWHAWFSVQAGWTADSRQWLYQEAGLAQAHVILEVGCGTGVIAEELARSSAACIIGLDQDADKLAFASRRKPTIRYVRGDAHSLPFLDESFDAALCHYLLLWLKDPMRGMQEMARVVRPGGVVLACAEPDYGGRLDYPPALEALGKLQAESLRRQGADPAIGRRLGELFAAAGLQATVGVIAGRWRHSAPSDAAFAAEWRMREHDLAEMLPPDELQRLKTLDRQALEEGRRVLFVPTFYALGRKVSDPGI